MTDIKTFIQFATEELKGESRRYQGLARKYGIDAEAFEDFDDAVQQALQDFTPTSADDISFLTSSALDILSQSQEGESLRRIIDGRGPDSRNLRKDLESIASEFIEGFL